MVGTTAEGEETVFCSHDLLRTVFLVTLRSTDDDERRLNLRKSSLATEKLRLSLERGLNTYDCFCAYMRDLLSMHPSVCEDIRFKPESYVALGDKIHQKLCSHLRGMDHMYELPSGSYEKMRYLDAIKIYAQRVNDV
jgi:hypothetical protein